MAFHYQKLFWTFTVQINCSSDFKKFANFWRSASNFQIFSRSIKQFFLTVGQNNSGNKIPFLPKRSWKSHGQKLLRNTQNGLYRRLMFQNVAYRPTLYKTGGLCMEDGTKKLWTNINFKRKFYRLHFRCAFKAE